MKIKKIDLTLWVLGIVYLIASLIPLIKEIIKKPVHTSYKKEDWIEEPLMIN
jgi:hypothetical protein